MKDSDFILFSPYLSQIEDDILLAWPQDPSNLWVERLTGQVSSINQVDLNAIAQPVLELISRGGKRWRPLVMTLTCSALNGDWRAASRLSSLVEVPHTGSLIIDDIEDSALLRRGRASIHLMYGIDQAINSGNFAYFAPTTLIDEANYPDGTKKRLYSIWACSMRAVHMGQGLDITWHRNPQHLPTIDQYFQMCRLKTGALASMAARLGAIISGATPVLEQEIGKVWMEIGLGFQMLDDVINITVGADGKKRGDDLIEGKRSLPVLLFCHDNPGDASEFLTLLSSLSVDNDNDLDKALDILINSGATDQAKKMAHKHLAIQKKYLNNLLDRGEALLLMNKLIDYFAESMA